VAAELTLGAHQCLFQRTDCLDQTTSVDTTEDIDAYLFIIGDSVLGKLLGEEYGAALLQRLGVESIPAAALHTLPRRITSLFYDCLPQHLIGGFSKLYAQAKVLEFLSLRAGHLAIPPEGNSGHTPRDPKMARLHEELTRLQEKAPTLTELAKRHGMSARALKERFRYIYDLSIFACISEARLAEAHDALLKTNTPIKVIAARLGYAHVSNFTSAFSNKYGYPPGKLRR
jgi:AraC-like DNA-binding protein